MLKQIHFIQGAVPKQIWKARFADLITENSVLIKFDPGTYISKITGKNKVGVRAENIDMTQPTPNPVLDNKPPSYGDPARTEEPVVDSIDPADQGDNSTY